LLNLRKIFETDLLLSDKVTGDTRKSHGKI